MAPLVPTDAEIDRERLLDISVNLIPMGILAFFVVLFAVYSPFRHNLFMFLMSHFLTVFPLLLLGLLTYVSAKVIARDEERAEQSSEGAATPEEEYERSDVEETYGQGTDDEGTGAAAPDEGADAEGRPADAETSENR
ncbi:DUF6684 family protein [Halomarina halobia]|uniref:DUF6684 family protein n=1 Tax=Halomarina halobia TaxID=3033386 RepID=A0ABD6ADC7_9EURY|nr:DUF6684 family protein [Halomarina sp. PSR21]